jgi:hypothetical protein
MTGDVDPTVRGGSIEGVSGPRHFESADEAGTLQHSLKRAVPDAKHDSGE